MFPFSFPGAKLRMPSPKVIVVRPIRATAEVVQASRLENLPKEVCFAICQNLGWKELLFLEVASKATRNMVAEDPLIWALQVLKTFPQEHLPKPVMKCLASPLSGSINWREVFMELRFIQPACTFEKQPLPGWEPPARLNARLDRCQASDYKEVLIVGKRSSFIAKFEALPPGNYVLMCRMKVAPSRKAYISYSAKFSRKASSGLQGEGCFTSEHGDAASTDPESEPAVEVHPTLRLDSCPAGSCSCPAGSCPGNEFEAANSQVNVTKPSQLKQLWKKVKPSTQILLGSYSSSWRQVGLTAAPTISSLFLGRRLERVSSGVRSAQIRSAQQEEGASTRSQGARVMELTQVSRSSAAPQPPPNANDWQVIPVGHVSIRAACRSTNIQLVALSTNHSSQQGENVLEANSIFVDYVCLRPVDDAVVSMLPGSRVSSMPLARSLRSHANPVARLFNMGKCKSKSAPPSALSLL
eukprot:gene17477-23783_t